jgi:peroxiredoxin Q/BCP
MMICRVAGSLLSILLLIGSFGCQTGPGVGQAAPDFTATTDSGQPFKLSSHLSDKAVALYFHPNYEALGCFTRDCAFRERLRGYQRRNYDIVGVAYDTYEREKTYSARDELSFTRITDPNGIIARQYGVAVRDKPGGQGVYLVKRRAVLIDKDGQIDARLDVGPECACGPKFD